MHNFFIFLYLFIIISIFRSKIMHTVLLSIYRFTQRSYAFDAGQKMSQTMKSAIAMCSSMSIVLERDTESSSTQLADRGYLQCLQLSIQEKK